MLKTYVSNPVEIRAIQYTGGNFEEIKKYFGSVYRLYIATDQLVSPDIIIGHGCYYDLVKYGDYVFKNSFGKIVVVSKDRFEDIYEPKE